MCLLVTQPEGTTWTNEFLLGVYKKNKDGVGVMYAEDSVLYHARCVPSKFDDFLSFYNAHIAGRKCAWHARMATHGDIDMSQTHPYEVISGDYPIYYMHNGILHTSNDKDETKSDSFWYAADYLRPMLEKNPTWFKSEAFQELVSSHIGHGNKFVLLDAYGNFVTINESSGVNHNGAWLSNTYAWDTTGTKFAPRPYVFQGGTSFPQSWATRVGSPAPVYTPSQLRRGSTLMEDIEEAEDELGYNYIADEALSFSRELFATLREANLEKAYKQLTYAQGEDYFDAMGEDIAYDVLECITLGSYTDEEIIAEILNGAKEQVKE